MTDTVDQEFGEKCSTIAEPRRGDYPCTPAQSPYWEPVDLASQELFMCDCHAVAKRGITRLTQEFKARYLEKDHPDYSPCSGSPCVCES
jgi:hypothetical protein